MTEYGRKITGSKYDTNFKVYITKKGRIIYPFHDIPLFHNDQTINVINEIPRFENAKFEVNTKEKFNPIHQDRKKEKVRFVANIFPSKGYPWNYGAIPQTWEDPDTKDKNTQCYGDNDPLDVIDISNVDKEIGEIYTAKVLGCLGLIDEGECDWKIVVVDSRDENCKNLHDIEDLKTHFPGLSTITYNWFRNYKMADGKAANKFLDGGELKNKEFAMKIINECHESWKNLYSGKINSEISRFSFCENEDESEWEKAILNSVPEEEKPIPNHLSCFYYVRE